MEERFYQGKETEGLEIIYIDGKGRSAITTRCFKKNESLCEYSGELLTEEEGEQRESQYSQMSASYVYYSTFKGKKYWWVM